MRHCAVLFEFTPARGRFLRQAQVGLGEGQRGLRFLERRLRIGYRRAGLLDLLVELGGFDFGKTLAGLDVIAVIGEAFHDVTVGARENGRFDEGLQFAWKLQR